MENFVIKNSKRPYHSTMGPLLEDFTSLSKRRKKLFDNINAQIDSLIKLLQVSNAEEICHQETDEKLTNHNSNHLNGFNHLEYDDTEKVTKTKETIQNPEALNGLKLRVKYESSDTGNETSSTDMNNESVICDCTKETIKELVTTVKSYDTYRKINRSLKEFNSHFNDMGRSLLGTRGKDSHEMLSPVKLDEKLVFRMVGMHLLHYGLFEVYEQLKLEGEKLWGPNHKGTIGEVMVLAYKTLHDLINKIQNCKIDEVLEWTKNQYEKSNLHIQRFNEIMINLYKIRFLRDIFEAENGEYNQKIIQEVKNSGLTNLWKIHNEEIGKLVTQVILGENKPNTKEFEELKNKTIKIFTKLFCETGILVKKPENYEKKPIVAEPPEEAFSIKTENKEEKEEEEPSELEDFIKKENSKNFKFISRPVMIEQKTIKQISDKGKYKSWLLALTMENRKKTIIKNQEDKGIKLKENWINFKETEKNKKKQPRMAYRYLNSSSLEYGRRLNFIKNRLNATGNAEEGPMLSNSTLISTLCDPETICRQNLTITETMLNNIPYYMESQLYEDEMSSLGRMAEQEDWGSTRADRTTTVLIATGTEESEESILGLSNMGRLIENYSTALSTTEETPQRTTPTFSLTVFAGPSIFRDSRLSSQLLEADIISQRLLNVSPGSRIRIRFPSRSEETQETQTRRETSISPYEQTSTEQTTQQQEEEQTTAIERSSITLRDILRMIMRGLRAETQTAVVRFRGSRSQNNLEDSRTSSIEQDTSKDKGSSHKRLVRPKPQLRSDQYLDAEYVRVHLPYESPLSVVTCAGQVTFPYLVDVLKVLFKESCEVSSKVGMWLKSNQQLPVESDLGPAFHFHSYLTCAVSKDQTSNENLPIMLSCGHVICKICHDRLSGKRRKRQFKCPMCPTIVEPNQTMELYLDWNCNHNPCVY